MKTTEISEKNAKFWYTLFFLVLAVLIAMIIIDQGFYESHKQAALNSLIQRVLANHVQANQLVKSQIVSYALEADTISLRLISRGMDEFYIIKISSQKESAEFFCNVKSQKNIQDWKPYLISPAIIRVKKMGVPSKIKQESWKESRFINIFRQVMKHGHYVKVLN